MVIFKAGRFKDIRKATAPFGYTMKCSESGYINEDLFTDYGGKFLNYLKEKNILGNGQKNLLLDLHSSPLFNAKFMCMMLEHNAEVCSFSPHCTHVLQPLDNVLYAVLKQKYQKDLLTHNFKVIGAKLYPIQLFRVLVLAFTQAFSPYNIIKSSSRQGSTPLTNCGKLKDLGPNIITNKCKSIIVCCPVCYFIHSFQFLSDLLDLILDFQVKFMVSRLSKSHMAKRVRFSN